MGCILGTLLVCLIAGYYVQATVNQLQQTHHSFNDRQLRNGYVAMSDVQRLVLVLQEAHGQREITPDARERFQSAADFLFVRTDTFRRVQISSGYMQSADDAISALQYVQVLADQAVETDFENLEFLATELTERAQVARQALVTFLDEMRRFQDQLLLKQSVAVAKQRNVIWVTLLGLSLLGIAATLLLRREVTANLARHAAEARVKHLAFFDPLTGLPNRVQFQDRLFDLVAQGDSRGLMLVDLDGFKQVNDTYGHAAGDRVLQHVAATLGEIAQPHGGLAARLGGDEFAIIMPSEDPQFLTHTCRAIIEAVDQPVIYEGEALRVAVSIGVAADMQADCDGLMRAADFALYASKSSGKGQFTFYDGLLEEQLIQRRRMIEELPTAIDDGSVSFFLQPKVDLGTACAFGFEALARWQRDGEIVPPSQFISVAEESGLIADLDCRLLQDSTRVMAEFNRKNGTTFSVSVNFSAVHFTSLKFAKVVQAALESSGLPPHLLTIEITETVEMQDWARAKEVISMIHALGARISIDDFGTGFSSLAYLRKTVADEIKIDRSLVADIETSDPSRFLLDAVLDIAAHLELDVVVEGVETRAQADIIRSMGAYRAQGYYFGKPAPYSEVLERALEQQIQLQDKSA